MKTGTIINGFKIVEAFGTPELIEKLANEAIGIAGCTGSIGASASEVNLDEFFNRNEVAKVKVERVGA